VFREGSEGMLSLTRGTHFDVTCSFHLDRTSGDKERSSSEVRVTTGVFMDREKISDAILLF
jgi:hypothetical protein